MTGATRAVEVAHEQAQAALRATPTADLLRNAYALTHRIHVGEGRGKTRRPMTDAEVDELRAMRDRIDAEVIRRAGE